MSSKEAISAENAFLNGSGNSAACKGRFGPIEQRLETQFCYMSSLSSQTIPVLHRPADAAVVQESFAEPALLPFSSNDFLNKKKVCEVIV
ncbi:hypothetical protein Tcan_02443 [Toxocara canis]|uniref:Uncharacterized protein n=1 Tax=Toxocara canis TaxID=6265 RepID=A0A0B2UPV1_TOXCA|nr:hypothetical protein Tcan_02443 [Toxocara canis]